MQKKQSFGKNPSITRILHERLLLEEQAEKHRVIHQLNAFSEKAQPHLSVIQQLRELLEHCCVDHPLDVSTPTAHIPTLQNIPIQGKPFRHKPEDEAELRSQVQEQLEKGLIRSSQSNCACTAFFCS